MKVSIIIPVYNAEKYIDKCFKEILNQTYQDFEIIAINDGSTDSSSKILKKYESKYKFITVINQNNTGQAIARNKAIDIANGEYLTFIDIDDFIDTHFLEELTNAINTNKADMAYCDYYEYYGPSKLVLYQNNMGPILANYAPWGKIYKTDFFKKYKLRFLEGKLFEDIPITPVLAGLGKAVYVPLPLYYYNKSNVSSIRRNTYSKKLEDIYDAIDETIYNFRKYKIFNKYKNEIEFIYLDSFLKGGVLRFADYKEGIKQIKRVREKVLEYFPNILNNPYYLNLPKNKQILYKICLNMNPTTLSNFKRLIKKVKR